MTKRSADSLDAHSSTGSAGSYKGLWPQPMEATVSCRCSQSGVETGNGPILSVLLRTRYPGSPSDSLDRTIEIDGRRAALTAIEANTRARCPRGRLFQWPGGAHRSRQPSRSRSRCVWRPGVAGCSLAFRTIAFLLDIGQVLVTAVGRHREPPPAGGGAPAHPYATRRTDRTEAMVILKLMDAGGRG